jgi:hypothetical protein
VENLPAFTAFFPDIFSASQENSSVDEQALSLMIMMTQLARFKSTSRRASPALAESPPAGRSTDMCTDGAAATVTGGDAAQNSAGAADKTAAVGPSNRYLGSSAANRATEEVVMWMATAAAKQVCG